MDCIVNSFVSWQLFIAIYAFFINERSTVYPLKSKRKFNTLTFLDAWTVHFMCKMHIQGLATKNVSFSPCYFA